MCVSALVRLGLWFRSALTRMKHLGHVGEGELNCEWASLCCVGGCQSTYRVRCVPRTASLRARSSAACSACSRRCEAVGVITLLGGAPPDTLCLARLCGTSSSPQHRLPMLARVSTLSVAPFALVCAAAARMKPSTPLVQTSLCCTAFQPNAFATLRGCTWPLLITHFICTFSLFSS